MPESSSAAPPFFSICIPQYNRTSFLIEALKSMAAQSFRDFEVCISDDCSTDGREGEIRAFLEGAGLRHTYVRQQRNLRYDGNLRAALALASGRYCFLYGNDDALAEETSLEDVRATLERHGHPEVLISNYLQLPTDRVFRRIRQDGDLGSGPRVAADHFRDLSFVTGVVMQTEAVRRHATEKWDGSEQYQMYLGSRILAEGGRLVGMDRVVILQSIQIAGEEVDDYASGRGDAERDAIEVRPLPLDQHGRLVADAIAPWVDPGERDRLVRRIFLQYYGFPYPFNVLAYRGSHSWRYALGICLGMRPKRTLAGVEVGAATKLQLRAFFALVTAAALLTPLALFHQLQPRLYAAAKSMARLRGATGKPGAADPTPAPPR